MTSPKVIRPTRITVSTARRRGQVPQAHLFSAHDQPSRRATIGWTLLAVAAGLGIVVLVGLAIIFFGGKGS